jgi:4-deoxy-L-threo-5-hexosulose-uronate ketol-isomerase
MDGQINVLLIKRLLELPQINNVMEIRFEHSPKEVKGMTTAELRASFLTDNLMKDDQLVLVYSHYDRVIIGGVKPVHKQVLLGNPGELKADFFLQRREIGIINTGGQGRVYADGAAHDLGKLGLFIYWQGR